MKPAVRQLLLRPTQKRRRAIRVATFGDSTANICGLAQHDVSMFTTAFPATGATVTGISIDKFALPVVYSPVYAVGNGGISGDTTTGMLARDAAGASSTRKATADIIALRPDVILFRGGSINDIMTVTAANLATTVSAVYTRHMQLLDRLLAAGVTVIDEGIYGFNNGTANTATDLTSTRSAITQLNALYAADVPARSGRAIFLNPLNLLSDATGAYLSGMTADGTHLNQWGALVLARAEAAILEAQFGASTGERFSGSNCLSNASMSSTGSQAYGTQATGYSIGATNATRQNAKVEYINGVPWQTCEFVPTGAGNANGSIFMPFNPTGVTSASDMVVAANDVYGFEFDFLIQGLSGGAAPTPTQILGRLELFKNAAGRVVFDNLSPGTYSALGGSYSGKIVFGPWGIVEPSSNLTTSSDWFLSFTTADLVNGFKLGVSRPRIVKLGRDLTLDQSQT